MHFYRIAFIFLILFKIQICMASDILIQPEMTVTPYKYIVVFDIDGTLCLNSSLEEKLKAFQKLHSECPVMTYQHNQQPKNQYYHFFLPYLKQLFDYLDQHQARIVFFSYAIAERNHTVMNDLLNVIYDTESLNNLKLRGHFKIFSRPHIRPGQRGYGEYGNNIKDLKTVILPNESIDNAILIEDQPSYTAHDQKPCIQVIDVESWAVSLDNKSVYTFAKNNIYWVYLKHILIIQSTPHYPYVLVFKNYLMILILAKMNKITLNLLITV